MDLGDTGAAPSLHRAERSRRHGICWRVGTGTGTEWSVRAGPTYRAPGQVLQDRANPSLPRPGPQAEPTASLGQGGGPGLTQQYELSQTPPCFQGASPGAKGQERLPLPAGGGGGAPGRGWNPASRSGERLLPAQGDSWPRLRPEVAASYRSHTPTRVPPDMPLHDSATVGLPAQWARGQHCTCCAQYRAGPDLGSWSAEPQASDDTVRAPSPATQSVCGALGINTVALGVWAIWGASGGQGAGAAQEAGLSPPRLCRSDAGPAAGVWLCRGLRRAPGNDPGREPGGDTTGHWAKDPTKTLGSDHPPPSTDEALPQDQRDTMRPGLSTQRSAWSNPRNRGASR